MLQVLVYKMLFSRGLLKGLVHGVDPQDSIIVLLF